MYCPKCNLVRETVLTLAVKDKVDNGKQKIPCPKCKTKLKPMMSTPMFRFGTVSYMDDGNPIREDIHNIRPI